MRFLPATSSPLPLMSSSAEWDEPARKATGPKVKEQTESGAREGRKPPGDNPPRGGREQPYRLEPQVLSNQLRLVAILRQIKVERLVPQSRKRYWSKIERAIRKGTATDAPARAGAQLRSKRPLHQNLMGRA